MESNTLSKAGKRKEFKINSNNYAIELHDAMSNLTLFIDFQSILGDPFIVAAKTFNGIQEQLLAPKKQIVEGEMKEDVKNIDIDFGEIAEIAIRVIISLKQNDPHYSLIYKLLSNSFQNDVRITEENVKTLFDGVDGSIDEYIEIIKESIKVHIVPLYVTIFNKTAGGLLKKS